jgi:hypothetical protein
MMLTRRNLALLALGLALVMAWTGAAQAQATKVFTGKITQIARAVELDLGKRENFYSVRLDEYPKTEFRVSSEEAVRSGIVDAAGPTGVVTPKMSKGLGWRVKLTCDANKTGPLDAPTYRVMSLERLSD